MRDRVSFGEPISRAGRLWRFLRIPPRTVFVLIPLHMVGFLLLYAGVIHLVRSEIMLTHSDDARLLLEESVSDLFPEMTFGDHREVRDRLTEFTLRHNLLSLRLYDAGGRPITPSAPLDPAVLEFVRGGAADRFWFQREDGALALNGMLRIGSDARCVGCHGEVETLGVSALSLDLSDRYAEARRRTRRDLALLVASWILLMGLVNVATQKALGRSMARLGSGKEDAGNEGTQPIRPARRFILDPLSAQLHESLQATLESTRRREVAVGERLEQADRLASLGRMSAGLAHEIKNPLAGIHGALELLRDDAVEAGKRELYKQMLAELERVNETIQALLRFARPAPPQPAETNVKDLLEDLVTLMRPGLQRRDITLEPSVAPDITWFLLDPNQIRQVIVNLVNNAADAIDRNGRIRVQATPFPEHDGLIIAVADDGPGVPDDQLGKLFEPFFTTKFSGTGLGLSVARSLVLQHGGEIKVASTPGEGTTFFVILPRGDGSGPQNGEE